MGNCCQGKSQPPSAHDGTFESWSPNSQRLVGKPATSGAWLPRLGCCFLRTKKKFHRAHRAHAGNCMETLASLAAAGLKKLLPMLPTARWKARGIRSVAAAARLLFFAHKKKVSSRTPSARGQLHGDARVAGCCGPKKAPRTRCSFSLLPTRKW